MCCRVALMESCNHTCADFMGQTTIYLSGCRNRSECAGRYEPAELLPEPGGFDGVYGQIPQGHGGRDLQHRISSSTRLTANVQTVVGIISLLNYHLLSIEGNRTAASIPGYTALAAKASTVSTMALTQPRHWRFPGLRGMGSCSPREGCLSSH